MMCVKSAIRFSVVSAWWTMLNVIPLLLFSSFLFLIYILQSSSALTMYRRLLKALDPSVCAFFRFDFLLLIREAYSLDIRISARLNGRMWSEGLRVGSVLSLESEFSFFFRLKHPTTWAGLRSFCRVAPQQNVLHCLNASPSPSPSPLEWVERCCWLGPQ